MSVMFRQHRLLMMTMASEMKPCLISIHLSISFSYPIAAGLEWLGFVVDVGFVDKHDAEEKQWLLIAAKAWWRLKLFRW